MDQISKALYDTVTKICLRPITDISENYQEFKFAEFKGKPHLSVESKFFGYEDQLFLGSNFHF